MISKKMVAALNKQINAELYSGYLYWAMSSQASRDGLSGTARWFGMQATEEAGHARRLYDYVKSVGAHAVLDAIEKPPSEFGTVKDMFEAALAHEQKVTAMFGDLMEMATAEKDNATAIFLQWFVTEQVEEEDQVNDVLSKLKLAGDGAANMFMVDQALGGRAAD